MRFFLLPAASAAVLFAAGINPPALRPEPYLAHVKHLASPEFKGRGTGTPELEKAAAYISRQFQAAGLVPLDGRTFLQPFGVTTNPRLGKNNELSYRLGDVRSTAEFSRQFTPFNFSSSGTFEGRLVFVGYGITAKEYHYDDYAGVDVKDKFVIVLRHEPQEFDEKSVFAGKVYTEHAQFSSKATNAKLHGARGVILVNDVGNHPSDSDELELFSKTVGPNQAGIPFVQVKAEIVNKWLEKANPHGGTDIASIQGRIDKDLRPESFDLPDAVTVSMKVDLKRETRTVHNVLGFLPGETAEHIVIGAHYDHLGLGEQFSMAPSQAGTPHPGADDNASGTAGVIELARYFGERWKNGGKMKRGIVFLAFAGEELGLLGSSHYVNNPRLDISQAVTMINMDMIGRIREDKVYVGGLGTGSTFETLLNELARSSPLKLEFSDKTGYGSSDHTSFTTKQVPVLFFFSGLHADYHKPSDTWDKIDAPAATRLLEFVAGVTERIASGESRPQFVKVAEPPRPVSGSSGGGGGYGPYFGSIPDMADQKNAGVRFADVREGSPAGKAGLKAGDNMVEFDGKPIQNLYDFTYALRAKKAGDTVRVKVVRDGKPMEVDVVLEKRR